MLVRKGWGIAGAALWISEVRCHVFSAAAAPLFLCSAFINMVPLMFVFWSRISEVSFSAPYLCVSTSLDVGEEAMYMS